jgi:hypothetical protein
MPWPSRSRTKACGQLAQKTEFRLRDYGDSALALAKTFAVKLIEAHKAAKPN